MTRSIFAKISRDDVPRLLQWVANYYDEGSGAWFEMLDGKEYGFGADASEVVALVDVSADS